MSMGNSTNLTGLWSKGNRGTLWGVNLKPDDVARMIAELEKYRATGADLSLWANKVEAGSKKPAMSLKVGEPWRPDADRAPGGERPQYRDEVKDPHGDDGGIPF